MKQGHHIFEVNKERKEKLRSSLETLPEKETLREVRNTIIWPLDEEKRRSLELVRTEDFNSEDEDVFRSMLESDDFAKQTAALYLIGSPKFSLSGEFARHVSSFLKRLSSSEEYRFSQYFAYRSGEHGHDRKDKLEVVERVREKLEYQGEKLTATKLPQVRGREHENGAMWLLGSRKPVFATPDSPQIAKKLIKAKKALDRVREKYPFLHGLIVTGGISKGYSLEESDFDYTLLTDDDEAKKALEEALEGVEVNKCELACQKSGFGEDIPSMKHPSDYHFLFEGLYMGDREVLSNLQKQVISNTDPEQWEKIREKIAWGDTAIGKAISRFNLSRRDVEKIKIATLLTRVPPPYQEAKKTIL